MTTVAFVLGFLASATLAALGLESLLQRIGYPKCRSTR